MSSFQKVLPGGEVTYLYPELGLVHRRAGRQDHVRKGGPQADKAGGISEIGEAAPQAHAPGTGNLPESDPGLNLASAAGQLL